MSGSNQPAPQPAPQVIIVKQRTDGCLLSVLVTLLFGWIGLAAVALVAMTRIAWQLTVWTARVSWRATVATCRLSWRGSIAAGHASVAMARYTRAEVWPVARDGSAAFHKRFGVRGWAIAGGGVAAVAVALLLVGLLRH